MIGVKGLDGSAQLTGLDAVAVWVRDRLAVFKTFEQQVGQFKQMYLVVAGEMAQTSENKPFPKLGMAWSFASDAAAKEYWQNFTNPNQKSNAITLKVSEVSATKRDLEFSISNSGELLGTSWIEGSVMYALLGDRVPENFFSLSGGTSNEGFDELVAFAVPSPLAVASFKPRALGEYLDKLGKAMPEVGDQVGQVQRYFAKYQEVGNVALSFALTPATFVRRVCSSRPAAKLASDVQSESGSRFGNLVGSNSIISYRANSRGAS